MAERLLKLYEGLPAWAVAVTLALAACSFVASYVYQRHFGRVRLNPALALPVAVTLLATALFYLVVVPINDLPLAAKAGVARVLWLAMAACLTLYNAAMIFDLIRKLRGH